MARDNGLGLIMALGIGAIFIGLAQRRQTTSTAPRQAIDLTSRLPVAPVPVDRLVPNYSPGYTAAGTAYQPVDYIYSALESTGKYTEQQLIDANAVAGLYGYYI